MSVWSEGGAFASSTYRNILRYAGIGLVVAIAPVLLGAVLQHGADHMEGAISIVLGIALSVVELLYISALYRRIVGENPPFFKLYHVTREELRLCISQIYLTLALIAPVGVLMIVVLVAGPKFDAEKYSSYIEITTGLIALALFARFIMAYALVMFCGRSGGDAFVGSLRSTEGRGLSLFVAAGLTIAPISYGLTGAVDVAAVQPMLQGSVAASLMISASEFFLSYVLAVFGLTIFLKIFRENDLVKWDEAVKNPYVDRRQNLWDQFS